MSVLAPSEGAHKSLRGLLTQAGAVFSGPGGQEPAIHYGSPAGELAVCVSAVGLVDRSRLSQLVLEAPSSQLSHLTSRLVGGTVAAGGALQAAGAWWCGAGSGRIVVLCEPHVASRLQSGLHDHAPGRVALAVHDRSADWAAIELLGRCAGKVLRVLGVYGESGDARQVPPFTTATVAGCEVQWLLESARSALLLVGREFAPDMWQAIEQAGRPFGISCVGLDAASRYGLLERAGHRPRL
jgi:glycine cleavage system aminomethyltransferase T